MNTPVFRTSIAKRGSLPIRSVYCCRPTQVKSGIRPFHLLSETRIDQPMKPYTKIATATMDGSSSAIER